MDKSRQSANNFGGKHWVRQIHPSDQIRTVYQLVGWKNWGKQCATVWWKMLSETGISQWTNYDKVLTTLVKLLGETAISQWINQDNVIYKQKNV